MNFQVFIMLRVEHCLTMKMEAVFFSETSFHIYSSRGNNGCQLNLQWAAYCIIREEIITLLNTSRPCIRED
jgi:hypothetical protein